MTYRAGLVEARRFAVPLTQKTQAMWRIGRGMSLKSRRCLAGNALRRCAWPRRDRRMPGLAPTRRGAIISLRRHQLLRCTSSQSFVDVDLHDCATSPGVEFVVDDELDGLFRSLAAQHSRLRVFAA